MADPNKPAGENQKNRNELVASYLQVRKFIGFIGLSLPVLLLAFSLISRRQGPLDSISAYFYSGAREILVGSLIAIGVFLYAYKGFDKDMRKPTDKFVARAAAIGAVGIALSPMAWARSGAPIEPIPTWLQLLLSKPVTNALHGGFAVLFFASIATFCIINFCRCEVGTEPDNDKKFRNAIYRALGWFIIACTFGFVTGSVLNWSGAFVFWTETLAVWAFGLSWIIKGEAIENSIDRLRAMGRGQRPG